MKDVREKKIRHLRVCLIGNYAINHPKEAVICRAAEAVGVELMHYPLRTRVVGVGFKKIFRIPSLIQEIQKALYINDVFDAVIVAHGNYFVIPVINFFCKTINSPVKELVEGKVLFVADGSILPPLAISSYTINVSESE